MIPEKELTTKPLLRDEIVATLRSFIELKRADHAVRIEAERDLSERLKVSRLSLRSAIQTLVDEGLLLKKRGSGTYIIPQTIPPMVDLIAAPDIKPQDPFYSEFLAELSCFLAEQSINLRVLHLDQLPTRVTPNPLIVVGLVESHLMRALRATHKIVMATQSYPDSLEISQICFDDYRIGSEAASILYDAGHRHIMHLAGPEIYPSALQRRRGFVDRLSSLGVEIVTAEGKMNWGSGYELGDRVIELSRRSRMVTGIFAANDWMALGLMQRLGEGGVRIPSDLSIIGCDDIHLASEVKPHLSTFKWDMNYLIRELFSHLKSMITNGNEQHKKILLPARFVERASFRRLSDNGHRL